MKSLLLVFPLILSIILLTACQPATVLTPSETSSKPARTLFVVETSLLASPTPEIVPATVTDTPIAIPPTATHLPPTPTITTAPFLPQSVEVINPQNAADLALLAELPASGVSVAAFSSDGQWLATGMFAGSEIKVWNFNHGQVTYEIPASPDARIQSYLAFSPDGNWLAASWQGWECEADRSQSWIRIQDRSGKRSMDFSVRYLQTGR